MLWQDHGSKQSTVPPDVINLHISLIQAVVQCIKLDSPLAQYSMLYRNKEMCSNKLEMCGVRRLSSCVMSKHNDVLIP